MLSLKGFTQVWEANFGEDRLIYIFPIGLAQYLLIENIWYN